MKKRPENFVRQKRRQQKMGLHHIPEDAEEVADRAGKHEKMPYHVRVGKRLPEIEDAAKSV